MTTYAFYPHLKGGACLTFSVAGLPDDAAAMGYAALVLVEHPSAREVVVWDGDRRVGSYRRPGPEPAHAERILVIEDSYYQAEDLRDAFHDAGFGDVRCSGGEDSALSSVEAAAPDLAIVDIDLGHGLDFRVAEALQERGVPFVFYTAYDREALPARWRHVDHVLKPLGSRHVVDASRALLSRSPPLANAGAPGPGSR